MNAGYQATIVATTGGFLREGNATFMVGVEDAHVPDVLAIMKETCHTRTRTGVSHAAFGRDGAPHLGAHRCAGRRRRRLYDVLNVREFQRY